MNNKTYWLKADWQDEYQEVTKEKWIKAERQAGFAPKCGSLVICATGGFTGNGISGKIIYNKL